MVFGLDRRRKFAEYENAGAHVNSLFNVVGDKDHGFLFLLPDTYDLDLHQITRLGVQMAEGFVHDQQIGAGGIGPGYGHTLLHAAGKLARIIIFKARHIHKFDASTAYCFGLGFSHPLDDRPHAHVFQHGVPGNTGRLLKYVGNIVTLGIDLFSHQGDFSLAVFVNSADHIGQRRFAAARGADDDQEFVLVHMEVHIVQYGHLAETFRDMHIQKMAAHSPSVSGRNAADPLGPVSKVRNGP